MRGKSNEGGDRKQRVFWYGHRKRLEQIADAYPHEIVHNSDPCAGKSELHLHLVDTTSGDPEMGTYCVK